MAFSPKAWTNRMLTKLNAAAMIDLEERLSDYTDSVAAGGVELGYAQITSAFTQTGAGASDVTGLSVTVTVGSRPIVVILAAESMSLSSASGLGGAIIQEGATVLAATSVGLTTIGFPVNRRVRLTPSEGSHTYKIVLNQLVTGNTTLAASATGPASIQVIEV